MSNMKTAYRTHNCGQLRLEHAGQTVKLAGFLENLREVGSSLAFAVLRDFYGTTQLVLDNEALIAQIKGIANAKVIDADAIAKKLNNPRSVNIVLLGAISKYVRLIESEILEKAIAARFASKGEAVVNANLEAYHAGRQA